jgi:molybdate transport system substrate-binding protein
MTTLVRNQPQRPQQSAVKRPLLLLILATVLILIIPRSVSGAELAIAAAADLKFAFDELAVEFQAKHPNVRVRATYGSSGNFHAQLRNRAPFDLYFSADIEYPRKLAEAGLGLDPEVFLYATGQLVLWVPNSSPLDLGQLGMQALLAPSVRKIAIANPRHAPYGVAAVAAMKSFKVHDALSAKLVYGENVAQAAQFVESRSADIGVIALALAMAPPLRAAGRSWEIPIDSYPRMEQGGMILKWTQHPESARAFREFVLGEPGRAILQRHGFILPEQRKE